MRNTSTSCHRNGQEAGERQQEERSDYKCIDEENSGNVPENSNSGLNSLKCSGGGRGGMSESNLCAQF